MHKNLEGAHNILMVQPIQVVMCMPLVQGSPSKLLPTSHHDLFSLLGEQRQSFQAISALTELLFVVVQALLCNSFCLVLAPLHDPTKEQVPREMATLVVFGDLHGRGLYLWQKKCLCTEAASTFSLSAFICTISHFGDLLVKAKSIMLGDSLSILVSHKHGLWPVWKGQFQEGNSCGSRIRCCAHTTLEDLPRYAVNGQMLPANLHVLQDVHPHAWCISSLQKSCFALQTNDGGICSTL
mmetsp:Transcript_48444/g.87369  ORF Transcript_48444/g.87369 Transcript_48444/m.87369 type:complete len:239 (-) Transcript_48444:1119-1835(-)